MGTGCFLAEFRVVSDALVGFSGQGQMRFHRFQSWFVYLNKNNSVIAAQNFIKFILVRKSCSIDLGPEDAARLINTCCSLVFYLYYPMWRKR